MGLTAPSFANGGSIASALDAAFTLGGASISI
jgi:hypothetical protein